MVKRVMFVCVFSCLGLMAGLVRADGFTDPASWACFDVTDPLVDAQGGYNGAVVAGDYAYLTPARDPDHNWPGEFLRLDMSDPDGFDDPGAWLRFNVGDSCGLGDDGYNRGAYDGSRYVYFAPWSLGYGRRVLRFDTLGVHGFNHCSSWEEYNAANIGAQGGYFRAAFDGQYVYFAPMGQHHGEVLRFDTNGGFTDNASWDLYDYGEDPDGCDPDPHCTDPDGYSDVIVQGDYVYFSPTWTGSTYNSEVLRLDTSCVQDNSFSDPACWDTYTYPAAPDGYREVCSTGEHLYFAPVSHGTVLRYDLQCAGPDPFHDDACWGAFDPDVGTNRVGFDGAFCDERYVYFSPTVEIDALNGEILRYDTEGSFSDSESWDTFDFGPYCDGTNCSDPKGYVSMFSDGRHLYFVPGENPDNYGHGEVLRYDRGQSIPTVSEWGMIALTLLMLTAGTLVFMKRRPATA